MTKYRILIVENHALLRAGLRALLSAQAQFEVVGEAADGCEALRAVGVLEPDLVLMDISMPGRNGIEAIIDIKGRHPLTRIVVVTMHEEVEFINASLQAGADGYVLRDAVGDVLEPAIWTVLQGKVYLG